MEKQLVSRTCENSFLHTLPQILVLVGVLVGSSVVRMDRGVTSIIVDVHGIEGGGKFTAGATAFDSLSSSTVK